MKPPVIPGVDLELAVTVVEALSGTAYHPLRYVEVTVSNGRVVLSGRVPRYHLKQVAQTVARSVPGVREVLNELQVVSPR